MACIAQYTNMTCEIVETTWYTCDYGVLGTVYVCIVKHYVHIGGKNYPSYALASNKEACK